MNRTSRHTTAAEITASVARAREEMRRSDTAEAAQLALEAERIAEADADAAQADEDAALIASLRAEG